jgi:hypothetical protein
MKERLRKMLAVGVVASGLVGEPINANAEQRTEQAETQRWHYADKFNTPEEYDKAAPKSSLNSANKNPLLCKAAILTVYG